MTTVHMTTVHKPFMCTMGTIQSDNILNSQMAKSLKSNMKTCEKVKPKRKTSLMRDLPSTSYLPVVSECQLNRHKWLVLFFSADKKKKYFQSPQKRKNSKCLHQIQ